MSNIHKEVVVDIHYWTDGLFSFRTTRDGSGFVEGSQVDAGDYVIEKAFVEK